MMSLQTTALHDGVTNAAERKIVIFSILWRTGRKKWVQLFFGCTHGVGGIGGLLII